MEHDLDGNIFQIRGGTGTALFGSPKDNFPIGGFHFVEGGAMEPDKSYPVNLALFSFFHLITFLKNKD